MTTFLFFNTLEDIIGISNINDTTFILMYQLHIKIYNKLPKKQRLWFITIAYHFPNK